MKSAVILGDGSARRKNAEPKGGPLVVLDSWALLAFLKDEPPAERLDSPFWTGDPGIIDLADHFACPVVDLR